jgi:ankyrin repeat protein
MKNMHVKKITKFMMLLLSCSIFADVQAMRLNKSSSSSRSSPVTLAVPAVATKGEGWEAQIALNEKLHTAVFHGNIDNLQKFIAEGADPNCKDDGSRTPLHRASERGFVACIQALITAGADMNSISDFGWTPLDYAVYASCGSRGSRDITVCEITSAARLKRYENCIKLLLCFDAQRDIGKKFDRRKQALVNRCAQELADWQKEVIATMRAMPEFEKFPPGVPELVASYYVFLIDPIVPVITPSSSSSFLPNTPEPITSVSF